MRQEPALVFLAQMKITFVVILSQLCPTFNAGTLNRGGEEVIYFWIGLVKAFKKLMTNFWGASWRVNVMIKQTKLHSMFKVFSFFV